MTTTAPDPRRDPIELQGLGKHYFGARGDALRDLTATIAPGAITAVLGPNGSGKTTLLRILAGQLAESAGGIAIGGRPLPLDARIPYTAVAHGGNNLGEFRMRDALRFAQSRPGWDGAVYERLARAFDLPARGKLHRLSTGQQSGFAIACGLASGAPIVIIDEAHAGLDVPKRFALYEELVRANAEDGRTVLIASHNVGELERLAERLLVLRDGRLIGDLAVEELRGRYLRLVGPSERVAQAAAGAPVVSARVLGPTSELVVDLDGRALDPLPAGVLAEQLDFQEAFVALVRDGEAASPKEAAA
ncbi:MAG: ABC transporter ATP-binding protein [Microbacteriaceae bacterium]|nr:ABC transporter ATP-binding protein [Microbacteriaceae bacterium]